jgi:hypothetical protein
MASLLSKGDLIKGGNLPFPHETPEEKYKHIQQAYQSKFLKTLKSMANGIKIYADHGEPGKKNIYRYFFTPGAYQYQEGAELKWMKPHLNEIIGSNAKASDYFKKAFEIAFPGFPISIIDLGDWNYSVDIDLTYYEALK